MLSFNEPQSPAAAGQGRNSPAAIPLPPGSAHAASLELTNRRKHLAAALTAHNLAAVRACLHPDFAIRDVSGGIVLNYEGLMRQLPLFFDHHPEYRQSVEVENILVREDRATLTSRHVEELRTWRRAHEVSSQWDEIWLKAGESWLMLEEKPHAE